MHPTILHLITLSDFFKFLSKSLSSLFSSFSLESLDLPMHHAIALSDFFVIFVKIVQHFRRFGHFCSSLELGSCLMNNIMLMLRECYYTQQFFVIFIKIVLFVGLVIFFQVFKPWYALCKALGNFVFLFLVKIVTIMFLCTFGPSDASCHCTQQVFCNFVSFVDHLWLFVTLVNFVIACTPEHIS